MNDQDKLEAAIYIASRSHMGQRDKAGKAYILHPLRVMSAVQGDIEKQVAVLHDVVEDTNVTLDELRFYGFCQEAIDAIESLTRREGEAYFDFIQRVKLNPIATKVKLADLADNMDLSRLPEVTERDLKRQSKYEKAVEILRS